jgi:hypothetical protein
MTDRASSKKSSERVFIKQEIERELDEGRESDHVTPTAHEPAQQGISNHPAVEEDEEQRKLPPRGHAKA